MIVGTQCGEGAEPMGQVVVVSVVQGNGPGAAVETGSWKDAVGKVMREERVFFE